jgi:hypothetical protein
LCNGHAFVDCESVHSCSPPARPEIRAYLSYNPAVPVTSREVDWWIWLLYAVGAAVILFISLLISLASSERRKPKWALFFGFLTAFAGASALGFALMSIIRFIQWSRS